MSGTYNLHDFEGGKLCFPYPRYMLSVSIALTRNYFCIPCTAHRLFRLQEDDIYHTVSRSEQHDYLQHKMHKINFFETENYILP